MAADEVLVFLGAVDTELARHASEGETLDLHLIGRAALILGYGLRLMTKDVDVVEVEGSRLLGVAVAVFKKGARRMPVTGSTWRRSRRDCRRCRRGSRSGAWGCLARGG